MTALQFKENYLQNQHCAKSLVNPGKSNLTSTLPRNLSLRDSQFVHRSSTHNFLVNTDVRISYLNNRNNYSVLIFQILHKTQWRFEPNSAFVGNCCDCFNKLIRNSKVVAFLLGHGVLYIEWKLGLQEIEDYFWNIKLLWSKPVACSQLVNLYNESFRKQSPDNDITANVYMSAVRFYQLVSESAAAAAWQSVDINYD